MKPYRSSIREKCTASWRRKLNPQRCYSQTEQYKLLTVTFWLHTLRWTLIERSERHWGCARENDSIKHNLNIVMCAFAFLPFINGPRHEKTFFLQDINCICQALQFDTIQAMLWCEIQYDLDFLLGLLWPWPLTYIGIYIFAYGARYASMTVCNHYLK